MLTALLLSTAVTMDAPLERTEPVRLSLPTEDDRAAWASPGLVVEIGLGGGRTFGAGPAASFSGADVSLRALVRLERAWSLATTLRYTVGVGSGSGSRRALSLEAVLHPVDALSVAFGVGYSGETRIDPNAARLYANETAVSHTLPATGHLRLCDGRGLTALARVDALWVAGPTFATGPYLIVDALLTECTDLVNIDPDSGHFAEFSQWWRQAGVGLGWWFAWR